MTLSELYNLDWNCMSDYPTSKPPWRAPIVSETQYTNQYKRPCWVRLQTNRTQNKWWLIILHPDGQSMHSFFAASSTRKAQMWQAAIEGYTA